MDETITPPSGLQRERRGMAALAQTGRLPLPADDAAPIRAEPIRAEPMRQPATPAFQL